MKRKPSSPNHIQTVSKEPVSGIQMARVADEKERVELRPWVCRLSRMGSSFSTGSPPRSPASRPQHDQLENLKIVTIQLVC